MVCVRLCDGGGGGGMGPGVHMANNREGVCMEKWAVTGAMRACVVMVVRGREVVRGRGENEAAIGLGGSSERAGVLGCRPIKCVFIERGWAMICAYALLNPLAESFQTINAGGHNMPAAAAFSAIALLPPHTQTHSAAALAF